MSTECLKSVSDTMTLDRKVVLATSWSLALSSVIENHICQNVKGINETTIIIGVVCVDSVYKNTH